MDQPTDSKSDKKVLAGAAKSASLNVLLQLMLRCMTFGLNALVLRFISRDMLGVVNVRLMLLYSTTLALSLNAIELAAMSKTEGTSWTQIINLSWCTVPIGGLISCLLVVIWTYMLEVPDSSQMPYYSLCVVIYALACILDLSSTPTIILRKRCHFVKLRVVVCGVAELTKCVMIVTLIIYLPQLGLLNFALAQLVYGFLCTALSHGYFVYYLKYQRKKDDDFPLQSVRELLPSTSLDKPCINQDQAYLAVSIFKQSVLKQFLSEGERYVMTVFDVLSFGDQGIYDVVNNLGSLITRFLFLPVEESGYLFFSQLLVRGQLLQEQKQDSLRLATNVLCCMTKGMILFGAVNLTFGYAYSYLALDLYGGTILSSGVGPTLLRWYCLYVLVLAINGTTECFVFTTMSKHQVDRYNQKMLLFSGLFLVFALLLTRHFGSVGFILANCLNMGARITHSLYYIHSYYKESEYKPLQNIFPSPYVIVAMVISLCITFISESWLCCDQGLLFRLLHIGVGGVCLLMVTATVYLCETNIITFIKEQYASRHRH